MGVSEEKGILGGLFARIVLTSACLALVAASATLASPSQVGRASQATTSMGIDADPTGNSATSLGQIDACVSVAEGDSFDVDLFVQDVTDLVGLSTAFTYDPAVLHVAKTNIELFLAGSEPGRVLNLSDVLPDQDGMYGIIIMEVTPGTSGHSGTGVMVRLTLQAVGTGMSFLRMTIPAIADTSANIIGDVDGDELFDGPVSDAQVWVGEPCPDVLPSPTAEPPTPTPEVTPEATPEATPPTTIAPSTPGVTPPPGQPTATPSGQASPQATASEGGDDDGFPWVVVGGAVAATFVAALAAALVLRWLLGRVS